MDEFVIVLALIDGPERHVNCGGRHIVIPAKKASEFTIFDFSVDFVMNLEMVFDNVHLQFSRSALESIAVEQGLSASSIQQLNCWSTTKDDVVRNLAHSLLPALAHPTHVNQLFVDSVATALLSHLTTTFDNVKEIDLTRGGLSPRMLRRAQDIMVAHLRGDFTLEAIANACGLSRAHFARAFKRSAGLPPHRWLMQQRIERSKQMLTGTRTPLAEIAQECGYADQSHFTRSFSLAVGMLPSEWRRGQLSFTKA